MLRHTALRDERVGTNYIRIKKKLKEHRVAVREAVVGVLTFNGSKSYKSPCIEGASRAASLPRYVWLKCARFVRPFGGISEKHRLDRERKKEKKRKLCAPTWACGVYTIDRDSSTLYLLAKGVQNRILFIYVYGVVTVPKAALHTVAPPSP